ncbi:MAG: UDP-N-acetylglucosamine 2-epimerase (hydrolyzing) [Erysipelotrichales bacterium]|nr:UDP-N-acetylglucosamine 2-epimerase (hydrolyzing) [Erysipelotrichales bacterium]
MFKVCVITATRAEYGLLSPLMKEISQNPTMQLQLIVTGTHLSTLYGTTMNRIEEDGFEVDEYIDILDESDDELGIITTMSNAQVRIAEALQRLQSDVVVVLGDRYELVPIVSSCVVLHIPVCHIHGGEITQGAMDELFRHAISKMSTIHFASTKSYSSRLIQMGEQPDFVFNVGSLGVENIKKMDLLSEAELEKEIGFKVDKNTLLVTFHPITLEGADQAYQMQALLDALELREQYRVLFTRPNSDMHRNELNDMIDVFVAKHSDRCAVFSSLGQLRYLSAMKHCLAVVGNSSSGIIETPSFGIPTIDIGNRQKGRISASSVVHVEANKAAILYALDKLEDPQFLFEASCTINPYEGKDTALNMCKLLQLLLERGLPSTKKFYDRIDN